MKNELIATLYKKIEYDNGSIFIFKPIEVVRHCIIDENGVLTIKGKDIEKFRLYNYESIDFLSLNEKYAYGYEMYVNDLKNHYNIDEDDEIIEIYKDEIFKNILFGVYDEKENRLKTILADSNQLLYMADESWFYNFQYDYFNEDCSTMISLKEENFYKLEEAIKKNNMVVVDNFFDIMHKNLELNKEVVDEQSKIFDDVYDRFIEETDELFNQEEPLDKNQIFEKLNDLVGIENVKNCVKKISATLTFLNAVKDHSNLEKANLNMFFIGNPGTGKTTVAKIMANILYTLGWVKNKKFAELTTTDLIGEYVGHTGPKTRKILEKYEGGVVFIDEAYTFANEGMRFGNEALAEILKELEKQKTIFIFAGYKKEMEKFINMNSGLRSRIGYFIEFNNYNLNELIEMFDKKIKNAKLMINKSAKSEIALIISQVIGIEDFGNGRFIDKLFDQVIVNHALNVENIDDMKKLLTITKKDVTNINIDEIVYNNSKKREIGFVYTKK